MEILTLLLTELDQEALTTRKMLERVPQETFGWKPHEKSMDMKSLATHIAELPSWVAMVLTTDELDFASNPYEPQPISNNDELLAHFEKCLSEGRLLLQQATEEQLTEFWTLRNGEQVYSHTTKYVMIRISFSQIVHHRAQLGVYLRLNNIPIPGSYGPSADDVNF